MALICIVSVAPRAAARETSATESGFGFALLTNGELIRFKPTNVSSVASVRLSNAALVPTDGHLLALTHDALIVLVQPAIGDAQVISIDPVTLRVQKRINVGDSAVTVRSIAVENVSGSMYLFENSVAPGQPSTQPQGAFIEVLDKDGLSVRDPDVLRDSDGKAWYIFDAVLSHDQRYAYVSYHGSCSPPTVTGCTTGADSYEVDEHRLACTTSPVQGGVGCIAQVHGQITPLRDDTVLATTGNGPLIRLSAGGRLIRRYDARLHGEHLLHFALTPKQDQALVIGACAYGGGLSMITLKSGKAVVSGKSRKSSRRLCGSRIAVSSGGSVAISENILPVATVSPGKIVILNAARRRVRTIRTSADPIDLLLS